MLYSVSFDLEIVTREKNLRTVDISKILLYLKTTFIYSKVNSAEITDHCGEKHHYRDGEFMKSTQYLIWPDEPFASLIWKVIVVLKSNQIKDLSKNITLFGSTNDESYVYFWKFDESYTEFHQVLGSTSSKSKLSHDPSNFAFGNIVLGNCFVSHFTSHSNSQIGDLEVELVPHKKELNLIFPLIDNKATGNKSKSKVKLNYDCNSIKSAIIHHLDPFRFLFYAELAYAPKMFLGEVLSSGKVQIRWKRVNSCGPIYQNLLGNCNVIQLTWPAVDTSLIIPALYYWCRHLQFDLSFGAIVMSENSVENKSSNSVFPHKIRYALACLKSLSYNYQDDLQINCQGEAIINEFIAKQINVGKCDQVYRALNDLFDALNNGKVYNVFEHFKYLLNKVELEWDLIKDHERDTEQTKYIRTVIFTPSRTIFMPPVMTRTCQFLDMADPDHVLRVIYRDENNGPLGSTFKNFGLNEKKEHGQEKNINCITSMLKHRISKSGLSVAGRTYQYYGASPSQLKDGGMILYSKDSQNRTAASIRDSLGIVKEKNVPKYMARIGLSLSQVMAFVGMPEYKTKIYLTSDIYGDSSGNDKPYNFTDGCGTISLEAARYIYKDLIKQNVMEPKDDENYVPSAFQIRFMGSKGMLVVDPNLTGMTIVVRESMHKMYTKKDYRIGIVKVSEARRAYLNKPFIMVLNQIGLSNDVFLTLTRATVRDLNSSLYDEQMALMTMKMYSHLHRLVNLDAFANCNFNFTSDSFFRPILNLVVKQAVDNLKTKQRIPLPWFEARTMFGVCDTSAKSQKWLVDEFIEQEICQPPKFAENTASLGTGVLKYGQVFCWPSDFTEPIRGEVIVTKFPTSDLGGVRKLVAVDCEELHHIRDCIVFPVDGKRPHQDEMAGSDLDGDEYCIIWREDFLSIQERIAMKYPNNPKVEIAEEISDELMLDHHIKCVEANQVGQLANAQLAQADSKGYDSTVCKRIGYKYNCSLDAPKNGINSEYSLAKNERVLDAPDFMDKWATTPTYYSTRANGEIYRFVNLIQLTSETLSMEKFAPSLDIDERLLHPRMLEYIRFAAELLQFYESITNHLLKMQGLQLEIELFTGTLDGPSSLRNEASRSKDKEDAMVATIYSLLIKKMNERFDSKMVDASEDDKMAFASSIYYISKQKVKDGNSCIGLPFIGKCGLYLRQYMKSQRAIRPKNQNKTSTTNAMVPYNQHYFMLTFQKIKQKVENVYKTFLSYSKKIKRNVLKVSSRIDKIGKDLIAVSSSPENLIAKLIQETTWAISEGIENNKLNHNQLIYSIIPTLIWSLYLNETYLDENEKEKSENVNATFLVRAYEGESPEKLWKLLEETLAPDTQIEKLVDSKEKDCIPVMIFGSPTSIWVAKVIIGIHNRLCSICFKNYVT